MLPVDFVLNSQVMRNISYTKNEEKAHKLSEQQ